MQRGDTVKVLSRSGSSLRVRNAAGRTGWVLASRIRVGEVLSTTQPATATPTTGLVGSVPGQ